MDFMYSTIGGKPTQPHLDDLFDLIVKNFFNEVDKNSFYLLRLPKEELEFLNEYRKKFGMPIFKS